MNDDWRLRIEMHEDSLAGKLLERLDASELEHQLESSFHDRVIVSRENSTLFLYTGSRAQAEQAQAVAQRVAADHSWEVGFELRRWHPAAESWEDPDKSLPASDAERAAEHAELIASERAQDLPEFEVRVECSSRQAAQALADKLREEGLPSVQRSNYLLVGASDEDAANVLAQRLRAEAPPGSTVRAEGTLNTVLARVGPNPFAIFGGLGG